MSISPSARPFLTSRLSAAPTMRESWPTLTGRPAKRWRKFCACWRASSVVGATMAVCLPLIAVAKAARSATSVLPKPTSPHTAGPSAGRRQIVERRLDRARLVLRLIIRKAGAEFVVQTFGRRETRGAGWVMRWAATRTSSPAMSRTRFFSRALRDCQPGAAKLVEFAGLRAVAGQKFKILDRQEKPVAAGIVDFQTIVRRAGRLDGLQANEAADAMVDMDDEIARRQRRGFRQHVLRAPLALGRRTRRSPRMSCSPMTARSAPRIHVPARRRRAAARRRALRAWCIGGDQLQRFEPMLGQHMA